ncbi:energy-coupling factor transporter ATPase [Eggerthellaceae bacterium 3-80]|nr:ATP-binding cassette domain-containing protein [bacterium D16-34]
MRISFEGVSFSYTNPEHAEKRKRRQKKRKEAGVISAPASLADHKSADWGSDPEQVWALRDISFTIEDNEFLGIAGHTGSGKSTLIQHMNGLIHPTCGRVLLDGEDLADKAVFQRCRGKVGLVFQYPENQLFAPSVFEDVAFGPKNLGLDDAEVSKRVAEALDSVHLDVDALGDKSPFELSGGQQRRVAFAGVLAMHPQVLVLDEPVAGLDPVAREEFLQLISELHTQGITIVLVSHNMDDLARFADRILVLNEGEVFDLNTPAEVFTCGDALRSIGLDVPAAQKFALELRECGYDLPRDLYITDTLAQDIVAQVQLKACDEAQS